MTSTDRLLAAITRASRQGSGGSGGPAQVFAGREGCRLSASVVERDCVVERSLWAAVLEMAIGDATGEKPRYAGGDANAVRNSAIRWLISESLEPSSFRWICVLFDFDPTVIRQRVLGRVSVGRG